MSLRKILKERVDIKHLINSFGIELEAFESCYTGHCPLCSNIEHRRCFAVYPEKGEYECLVCGVKGDVLDFLTNIVSLNIGDAQDFLASKYKFPFKELRTIEVVIDPLIKRLSKHSRSGTVDADVQKVLRTIAKCELSPENQLQCLINIKKVTGIRRGLLKTELRKISKEIHEEKYEWVERNEKLIRSREYRRWKEEERKFRISWEASRRAKEENS